MSASPSSASSDTSIVDMSFFAVNDFKTYVKLRRFYLRLVLCRDTLQDKCLLMTKMIKRYMVSPGTALWLVNNPRTFSKCILDLLNDYQQDHPDHAHIAITIAKLKKTITAEANPSLALTLQITPEIIEFALRYYFPSVEITESRRTYNFLRDRFALNKFRLFKNGIKYLSLRELNTKFTNFQRIPASISIRIAIAKHGRLDILKHFEFGLAEYLHQIVGLATVYGQTHILEYIVNKTVRLGVSPKLRVPTLEIAQLLLKIYTPSDVALAVLNSGNLSVFTALRDIFVPIIKSGHLVRAAKGGNLELYKQVEGVFKMTDMRPFHRHFVSDGAVSTNAIEIVLHLEKEGSSCLRNAIVRYRPAILRCLMHQKIDGEAMKYFSSHTSKMIKERIVKSLNLIVTLRLENKIRVDDDLKQKIKSFVSPVLTPIAQ